MTEVEKFKAWLEAEKAEGLVHVHIGYPGCLAGYTEEEACALLNEFINAPTVPDHMERDELREALF